MKIVANDVVNYMVDRGYNFKVVSSISTSFVDISRGIGKDRIETIFCNFRPLLDSDVDSIIRKIFEQHSSEYSRTHFTLYLYIPLIKDFNDNMFKSIYTWEYDEKLARRTGGALS